MANAYVVKNRRWLDLKGTIRNNMILIADLNFLIAHYGSEEYLKEQFESNYTNSN